MKNVIFWLFLIFSIILQISLGQQFGFLTVALPLCLVTLVVFSAFLPTEQLLYMALVSGVMLDSASGRYFGLNISFLLFVVLFCKLVLRLGERTQTMAVVISMAALLVVLYNFLQFVSVFSIDHLSEIRTFGSQLLLQVGYSIAWAALVYLISASLTRSNLSFKKSRSWVLK